MFFTGTNRSRPAGAIRQFFIFQKTLCWKFRANISCKSLWLRISQTFPNVFFTGTNRSRPAGAIRRFFSTLAQANNLEHFWRACGGGGAGTQRKNFWKRSNSFFGKGRGSPCTNIFCISKMKKLSKTYLVRGGVRGGGILWEILNVSKVLPQPKILNGPAGALDRGPRGMRKTLQNFRTAHWTLWWFFRNLKNHFHMPKSTHSGGSPRSSPFWF